MLRFGDFVATCGRSVKQIIDFRHFIVFITVISTSTQFCDLSEISVLVRHSLFSRTDHFFL
jgi:hypothetical protein